MYLKVKEKLIIFILLNITVITTMGDKTKEEIYQINNYGSCKIHFMSIYKLNELQFDVLWCKYLSEKRILKYSQFSDNIFLLHFKLFSSLVSNSISKGGFI